MKITPKESEVYQWALEHPGATNTGLLITLATALRSHVAAEMRLEFEGEHKIIEIEVGTAKGDYPMCVVCKDGSIDPRHNYTDADWDRAAHDALMGGKSDG